MDYRKTDPEFMERVSHFAYDEVVNEPGQGLDAPTRYLAILAALIGCQGADMYRAWESCSRRADISPGLLASR